MRAREWIDFGAWAKSPGKMGGATVCNLEKDMLAMKGRFCRLIFCDTETKVELVRDVKLPHMLPQLPLTKLPSTI
jgi:hypothetical protein